MTEPELITLLRRADESEFGVVVRTNDPERLRQRLYPVMRAHGYSIRIEACANKEVRLVKKT